MEGERGEQKLMTVRIIKKGSKSLKLSVDSNGVAKTTVHKNTGNPPEQGETTFLYERAGAIFQSMADRSSVPIVHKFGTVHSKMKDWIKSRGVEMGYVITENEEDGRTLKAEKVFNPR